MLELVKLSLRITTNSFNSEIQNLIEAALKDLGVAGVPEADRTDNLVRMAVITYVKIHFGEPDNVEFLQRSYDEQKAQMGMASGYTDWGTTE